MIREEGSNGDREMAAAVHAAGMEPWDITMSDLLQVGGVCLWCGDDKPHMPVLLLSKPC